MDAAAKLLRTTEKPIKVVAWTLGYRHPVNFTRAFQRIIGKAPGEYRRERKLTVNGGNDNLLAK